MARVLVWLLVIGAGRRKNALATTGGLPSSTRSLPEEVAEPPAALYRAERRRILGLLLVQGVIGSLMFAVWSDVKWTSIPMAQRDNANGFKRSGALWHSAIGASIHTTDLLVAVAALLTLNGALNVALAITAPQVDLAQIELVRADLWRRNVTLIGMFSGASAVALAEIAAAAQTQTETWLGTAVMAIMTATLAAATYAARLNSAALAVRILAATELLRAVDQRLKTLTRVEATRPRLLLAIASLVSFVVVQGIAGTVLEVAVDVIWFPSNHGLARSWTFYPRESLEIAAFCLPIGFWVLMLTNTRWTGPLGLRKPRLWLARVPAFWRTLWVVAAVPVAILAGIGTGNALVIVLMVYLFCVPAWFWVVLRHNKAARKRPAFARWTWTEIKRELSEISRSTEQELARLKRQQTASADPSMR